MMTNSVFNSAIDSRRLWTQKSLLEDGSGAKHLAYTHDISTHGMSLFADRYYKPGQVCHVDIPVFTDSKLRHYRFNCRVVMSTLCGMKGFRTSLEFTEVPPENKTLIQFVMTR